MMPTLPTADTALRAAATSSSVASICVRPLSSRPLGDVLRRVAQVDAALAAVEERGRDHRVAVLGEAFADALDVTVDAEDLLRDDDAAARLAFGIGAVGRELEPVAGRQFDDFTHDVLREVRYR
jgi:hypothetical protein